MTLGEEQQRAESRRLRRAGDPRMTDAGRALLMRLVAGDLMGEFQAELDAVSDSDPLLGGGADDDA